MQGATILDPKPLKFFDPIKLGLHPKLLPLKIYVYNIEDNPSLKVLCACNGNKVRGAGIGTSLTAAHMESLVIDRISESAFRTSNAYEADFFLVPARPACLSHNGIDESTFNHAYKALVESLPFFQVSGGRNHIFVFTSSRGPLTFPDWCASSKRIS